MMNRQTDGAIRRSRRTIFVSLCAALLTVAMTGGAQAQCVGDCDGDCEVGINELIRGVNISLGSQPLDTCPAFDANEDGMAAINELIRGVGNALGGCGEQCVPNGSPSPTPTPTTETTEGPGTSTPATATPATPGTGTPELATATPQMPTVTPGMPTATRAPTPPAGLRVDGANSPDPWTVRVSFNGEVEAISGTHLSNYEIVLKNQPDAGGPEIVDVQFLRTCDGGANQGRPCNDTAGSLFSDGAEACPGGTCSVEDHRAVVLTTGAHAGVRYLVRATNVRDTAGNSIVTSFLGDRYLNEGEYQGDAPQAIKHCAQAMQEKTLETGRCYPLPCTSDADCPGAAPGACLNAIPDCDGDGLTDAQEVTGWDVTIANMNGTATRHVTSSPLAVDTDGDGVSDKEEKTSETGSASDARDSDTDSDGLDDYREVVLLRSDPAKSDSDGDGVTDFVEVTQYGSSPIVADSDGDSIRDGDDYLANGSDPRLADLPAFDIRVVEKPTVSFNYDFTFHKAGRMDIHEGRGAEVNLSDKSSDAETTTDTTVKEASAKLAFHAEAEVSSWPPELSYSAKVTVDADVGASWKNKVTKESAHETASEYQKTKTFMHELEANETWERDVKNAQLKATVRFLNTGPFALCLKDVQVDMRAPDPENPGEFIALGSLSPEMTADIELGPLSTTMHTQLFSAPLDGQSLEAVERLMRNPRSIIFDVGNFSVRSDPSGKTTDTCGGPSYAQTEQSIVNNTGEVTIDYGGVNGVPPQHLFVSSNLGRMEAVRDLNHDGTIDQSDEERVIFLPDGTYLYPRLTDALDIAGIPYEVDPSSGQLTSVGDVDNAASPHRKAWVILVRNDGRGTSRLSADVRYCGAVGPGCPNGPTRVDDIAIKPGIQVWITYLQDEDQDGVPRSVEDLYGTSDDNSDSDVKLVKNGQTVTAVPDPDGVSDFDEIYKSVPVTITNREGESIMIEGHSNPLIADTDGDGLSDGQERTMFTAPDRKDTDEDGLDDAADPDPLFYGCPPQTFHFSLDSFKPPGSADGYYPAGQSTQSVNSACSVTVESPPNFHADTFWVPGFGLPPVPVISVQSFSGFANCRLSGCEVSSCLMQPFLGAQIDVGGLCAPDNGPRCNWRTPPGSILGDTFVSSEATFDVECDH